VSLVPQLDDRSFEGLLEEARTLIPRHAPEWTDHNPSDPGIVMLELFTWLAEMLIFRTDQVPDRHTLTFLRLLRGPDWTPQPGAEVADEISAALGELRERWRVVTPQDYEAIAPEAAPGRIARVVCVPRRNLQAANPTADAPGVMSVVVLPVLAEEAVRVVRTPASSPEPVITDLPPDGELLSGTDVSLWIGAATPFAAVRIELSRPGAGYALQAFYFRDKQWQVFGVQDGTAGLTTSGTIVFQPPDPWTMQPGEDPPRYWLRLTSTTKPSTVATARRVAVVMPQPSTDIVKAVRAHLEPRRILTTRVVVVAPTFVPVGVDLLVARSPGVGEAQLRRDIAGRIEAFLDPFTGGPDGAGWPLGRSVYLSEVLALVDRVPGVDHVPDLKLTGAAALTHPDGDPVGIDIGAHRLPDARIDERRIVTAVAFVSVNVALTSTLTSNASVPTVRAAVKEAVRTFYHPLTTPPPAGLSPLRWPVAALRTRVLAVPGITAATAQVTAVPDRMTLDGAGLPVLSLRENELVDVSTEIVFTGP
jgi:hypothetical protein